MDECVPGMWGETEAVKSGRGNFRRGGREKLGAPEGRRRRSERIWGAQQRSRRRPLGEPRVIVAKTRARTILDLLDLLLQTRDPLALVSFLQDQERHSREGCSCSGRGPVAVYANREERNAAAGHGPLVGAPPSRSGGWGRRIKLWHHVSPMQPRVQCAPLIVLRSIKKRELAYYSSIVLLKLRIF